MGGALRILEAADRVEVVDDLIHFTVGTWLCRLRDAVKHRTNAVKPTSGKRKKGLPLPPAEPQTTLSKFSVKENGAPRPGLLKTGML